MVADVRGHDTGRQFDKQSSVAFVRRFLHSFPQPEQQLAVYALLPNL